MSISQAFKQWVARVGSSGSGSRDDNDLVYVKNYENTFEAEVAKSYLDSQDIQSIVSAEDVGGTRPIMVSVSGGARLLVRRGDAEKALRLLESEGALGYANDGADVGGLATDA